MIEVIVAAPDLRVEPDLVRDAEAAGVHVVRRCVDTVALLATAAAAPGTAVVVSAGLPRLSVDAVHRLAAHRRVVGLAASDSEARRLADLGVPLVAQAEADGVSTAAVVRELLVAHRPAAEHGESAPADIGPAAEGRVIAVWGPAGAPGRTTVALGMAEAIAQTERRVVLVDADTYAPGVALALGIVEDASGIVVACRHAESATLDPSTLNMLARRVHGSWRVLGGLPNGHRWPDLRPGALERLWAACRAAFDVTVIDVGFCLESDDQDGTWSRRRNAAALTAMGVADEVVVVADGSAAGAARVIAAWPDARTASAAPALVVRNRASGRGGSWRTALRDGGVDAPIRDVPTDARALAACWRHGQSLAEGARRSRVRRALGELAAEVVSG